MSVDYRNTIQNSIRNALDRGASTSEDVAERVYLDLHPTFKWVRLQRTENAYRDVRGYLDKIYSGEVSYEGSDHIADVISEELSQWWDSFDPLVEFSSAITLAQIYKESHGE